MHQVVTAQLAARRAGTQSTKTRAEVRGGGEKPFKQKGTGNARQGSTRAPHFSGGGVALGPKPRKYDQKTPKKMIKPRPALGAVATAPPRARSSSSTSWGFDAPKTKAAKAALAALGIDGKVLVVVDRDDANAIKSFRNLPEVQLIERRRAQRLRRALQRVDRVHAGHAPRRRRGRRDATRNRTPSDEGPPRHHPRARRVGEELRPHRAGRLHLQGPPRAPASPRSTTPSRPSGASRSSRSTPSTARARSRGHAAPTAAARKPDTKRAIVTLAAGDEIPLFEN